MLHILPLGPSIVRGIDQIERVVVPAMPSAGGFASRGDGVSGEIFLPSLPVLDTPCLLPWTGVRGAWGVLHVPIRFFSPSLLSQASWMM